jgi:hypothetical protein
MPGTSSLAAVLAAVSAVFAACLVTACHGCSPCPSFAVPSMPCHAMQHQDRGMQDMDCLLLRSDAPSSSLSVLLNSHKAHAQLRFFQGSPYVTQAGSVGSAVVLHWSWAQVLAHPQWRRACGGLDLLCK